MDKTNAIRLLEKAGLPFQTAEYEVDPDDLSAPAAAAKLGLRPESVFKTLVLRGDRGGYFVCCVPACADVDLKKAAKSFGDRKAELIPLKDLEPLTGYVRGGCSPIGMKKSLPTLIDETAVLEERISVSAGRRGLQILIAPLDLLAAAKATLADIV